MFFIRSCRAWETYRKDKFRVNVGDPFFVTQTRIGNRTRVFGKGFDFVIEDKICNLQQHIKHSYFTGVTFKNRKEFNKFLDTHDVVSFTDKYDPMKHKLGYHLFRTILFDRKSKLESAVPYLLDLDHPESVLKKRLQGDRDEISQFGVNLMDEYDLVSKGEVPDNYAQYLKQLELMGRIKLVTLVVEKLSN